MSSVPSVLLGMVIMLIIPLSIASCVHVIQALRRSAAGEPFTVTVAVSRDDQAVLELIAGSRSVRVERIILERDFAARVLAQPPRGFRERHPSPPPNYDAFVPDLGDLHQRHGVLDPRTIEAEKRRQHTELVNAWADMCEAAVAWEGRLTVRRGTALRLVLPMRTDVAAMGQISFIYSCRVGLIRTTATATTQYRPRLVALHG